jgi:hypothetical protein
MICSIKFGPFFFTLSKILKTKLGNVFTFISLMKLCQKYL